VDGLEYLDKVIKIDHRPLSYAAVQPGHLHSMFDEIRTLYAGLPESKMRGYKSGRFSFNIHGGRCEACQGRGNCGLRCNSCLMYTYRVDVCHGARFNRETLQ
jgi:excinuclease ABC subunit A